MKVLVTGGNGLIGKSLIKILLNEGIHVRAMDLTKSDITGTESCAGSILDINNINQAVRGCDAVIHLAAVLGVKRTETLRLESLNVNILGTVNILDACIKNNVKKIVYVSSSEVYGDQGDKLISETCTPRPKSIYAITKLASEEYVKAYTSSYNIDYSILRYFSVYGPSQVAEFVIPRFIRSAMDSKPLLVYGNGGQIRSFCYVDDIARGTVLALIKDEANSEIINIGNNNDVMTILETANKIIKISKKELSVKLVPFNKADRTKKRDINKRIPDISKAKELLDYEPKIHFDEGVKRVMESKDIPLSWIDPMEYISETKK